MFVKNNMVTLNSEKHRWYICKKNIRAYKETASRRAPLKILVPHKKLLK